MIVIFLYSYIVFGGGGGVFFFLVSSVRFSDCDRGFFFFSVLSSGNV